MLAARLFFVFSCFVSIPLLDYVLRLNVLMTGLRFQRLCVDDWYESMSLSLKHEHESMKHGRYVDNEMCVAFILSPFRFVNVMMLKSILLHELPLRLPASPARPQNNTGLQSIQGQSEADSGRCMGE